MNSSYLNMAAGAFLGTVFVVMSVSLVSESLFHAEAPEQEGFVIEVAEAETGDGGGAPQATPIANLLQTADAAAGEASFAKCQACHTVDEGGANRVGPNLWGVVNRPIASHEGFSYSAAMTEFSEGGEVVWDYEHLAGFLAAPRSYIQGTAMSFAGLTREDELANVIAYLRELSSEPAPLPEPVEVAEAPAEGAEGGEGEAAAAEGSPALAMLADADAANGESIFRRCAACHGVEEGGANRVGPNLWDIVGNTVANNEGFSYSSGMVEYSEGGAKVWEFANLDAFILAPREEVPGTSMGFAGLPNDSDRADLLAYLATLSNEPVELPAAGGEEAAAPAEGEAAPAEGEEAPAEEAAPAEGEAAPAEGEAAPAEDAAPAEEGTAPTEAPTDAEPTGDGAAVPAEGEPGDTDAAAPADDATEGDEAAPAEGAAAPADEEASAAAGGAVALIASADVALGEEVFQECAACHTVDEGGEALVGPNLWGVVNRDVAGVEGFEYSENFVDYGGEGAVWDYALLDQFLAAPMDEVEGTYMAYPGVVEDDRRAAVIAYLRTLAETPAELPAE